MTRNKKAAYAGIIAVGTTLFLIDRISSWSGPEPAAADAVSSSAPSSHGTTDAAKPENSGKDGQTKIAEGNARLIAQKPFPRGVKPWNAQSELRDLFAPRTDSNSEDSADNSGSFSRSADGKRRAGRSRFAQAHRLTGILTQSSLRIAVIDDRWMKIGDVIDGCALSAIEGTEVKFVCHDGEAVLNVIGDTRTRAD